MYPFMVGARHGYQYVGFLARGSNGPLWEIASPMRGLWCVVKESTVVKRAARVCVWVCEGGGAHVPLVTAMQLRPTSGDYRARCLAIGDPFGAEGGGPGGDPCGRLRSLGG